MITQLLGEWIERRRRVSEELRFHRDRLEEEGLALGYGAFAARKFARKRLGSLIRHRRQGREQLQARVCDLVSALLACRPANPWMMPSFASTASLIADRFLVANTSIAVPWSLWVGVLLWIVSRDSFRALQSRLHWRYYFYSVFSLLSVGLAASAAWSCMLLIWRLPRWPSQGWSVAVFSIELISYLLVCGFALQFWSRNRVGRCRSCAQKLRSPEEQGRCGGLLIEVATQSSVCPRGHGALTVGDWQSSWREYGDFWDEIVRASHL